MTPFLTSYFRTHPITLLLEILGGRMHGPSPHLNLFLGRLSPPVPPKSPPMSQGVIKWEIPDRIPIFICYFSTNENYVFLHVSCLSALKPRNLWSILMRERDGRVKGARDFFSEDTTANQHSGYQRKMNRLLYSIIEDLDVVLPSSISMSDLKQASK